MLPKRHYHIAVAFAAGVALMATVDQVRRHRRASEPRAQVLREVRAADPDEREAPPGDGGAQPARVDLAGSVRFGGRPIAGVRVFVGGGEGPAREALTDERGRFAFASLPAGRYAVRAVGEGMAAYREKVDVLPGAEPLSLLLAKAPALAGRVVDGADRPLAEVDVALAETPFAPLVRHVRTDGAGAFRVPAVLPGRYLLVASAPGFVGASAQLATSAIAGPGVQLRLARGATLVGEVVDEEQHGVAGARVALARPDGPALPESVPTVAAGPLPSPPPVEPGGDLGIVRTPIPFPPSVAPAFLADLRAGGAASSTAATGGLVTDGAGRFRIAGLAAGKVVAVVARDGFLEGHSDEVMLLPGVDRAVRVVLRRGRLLRGRVVGPRGAVAGAELWIDGALATVTDGKGRFELRRVAGPVEVEVRSRGYAPSRRQVDPAQSDAEVELPLGEPAERLAGVVVDGRGFPVAGARVTVEGAAGAGRRTVTSDRRGAFAVPGCGPGPLLVRVAHGEHLPATVAGVVPGDDLRVALASGGVVEGEVVADRGGVARGARVTVEDALGVRHAAKVDPIGRFRVAGCAPGAATVRAEAPGYLPATAPVELPPADFPGDVVLRDLRFALLDAGGLAGSVVDERRLPIAGAEVVVGETRARTDAAGRFRIAPLPPGRVEVAASSALGNAADSVVIERGRTAEIELRVR